MNAQQIPLKIGGYNINIINMPSNNVYVASFLDGGCIYETTQVAGINHLLEHILVNSWSKCNKEMSCFKYFDKYPVYFNATTTTTYINYYINGLRSKLVEMIEYIFEIMINPNIKEAIVNTEKEIVMNELQNYLNMPDQLLEFKKNQVFYNNSHIINFYDNKLQLDNLAKITYADIIKYYKKIYQPKNVHFYICGRFNDKQLQTIKEVCQRMISAQSMVVNDQPLRYYKNVFTYKPGLIYHKNNQACNTTFIISIPFASFEMQYIDHLTINVVAKILQTGLFDLLRTQKQLLYGIFAVPETSYYGAAMHITGSCVDANIKTIFVNIFRHLFDLQTQPIPFDILKSEQARWQMKLNDQAITPLLICTFYESQRRLTCNKPKKRTYTYNDTQDMIDAITHKNISKILEKLDISKAAVGYTSKRPTTMDLATILSRG
jgi:secreted Zn-dependent insulinase-like peptidase